MPRRRTLPDALFVQSLSERIHDFLDSITLADLVSEPNVREVAERQRERGREMRIPIAAAS